MTGTVLLRIYGGPWDGERRRFVTPPPGDIPTKVGGMYKLVASAERGHHYQWYREELKQAGG